MCLIHFFWLSTQIISTILDTKCFDPLLNPEICSFYINLHNLLGLIDAQSTLLWTSIAALQQALNSSFQKSLVDNFKYFSVLTKLLEEVTGKAKVLKLLNVLQKLTLNVKLTWNEPFLEKLIKVLVQLILGEEVTRFWLIQWALFMTLHRICRMKLST